MSKNTKLTPGGYHFAWHCPSPPPEHNAAAIAETDDDIVQYITNHAEEITPNQFAKAVGGWKVVKRDWWGEGRDLTAEFMRNDWSVTWYRSRYPDGTPVVFHTASGIEHVYELDPQLIAKGVLGKAVRVGDTLLRRRAAIVPRWEAEVEGDLYRFTQRPDGEWFVEAALTPRGRKIARACRRQKSLRAAVRCVNVSAGLRGVLGADEIE